MESSIDSRACVGETDGAQQERIAAVPLGRFITAEEIAQAALCLVSGAGAMVTGTAFEIDGGRLLT